MAAARCAEEPTGDVRVMRGQLVITNLETPITNDEIRGCGGRLGRTRP